MSALTRAERVRRIIAHLDALVDDLDGTACKCGTCGLSVKKDWSEANAKSVLRENRKKFERMLGQGWAKKGEDDDAYDARNVGMVERKEN